MMTLVALEKAGSISSLRDGLCRRFYVKPTESGSVDTLRTRIMLWVLDHPGIWEAQLAERPRAKPTNSPLPPKETQGLEIDNDDS